MEKMLSPRPAVILLSFLFIAGVFFAFPAKAQTEIRPFTHDGYSRPYLIYRPAHVSPHPAVVLMLDDCKKQTANKTPAPLSFTDVAWHFFAGIHPF